MRRRSFRKLKGREGPQPPKGNDAMLEFLRQHAKSVTGVLHGFDRLRFRGTLRRIASAAGLGSFLSYAGVPLKDAGEWMNARTEELKDASLAAAHAAGRPVQYVQRPRRPQGGRGPRDRPPRQDRRGPGVRADGRRAVPGLRRASHPRDEEARAGQPSPQVPAPVPLLPAPAVRPDARAVADVVVRSTSGPASTAA